MTNKTKKITFITLIFILSVVLVGCGQKTVENNKTYQPAPFIENLLSLLPKDYVVNKNSRHLESLGENSEPVSAVSVSPCAPKAGDDYLVKNSECFVKLDLWSESGVSSDINQAIADDSAISHYQSALGGKIKTQKISDQVSVAYSDGYMMCLGTGGDSCFRKRFVYLLADGSVVKAELSYPPYTASGKNVPIGTLPAEVSSAVRVIESILISADKK